MNIKEGLITEPRFKSERTSDVIVIDDDESMCEGCRQALEEEGLRAIIAQDGSQGLKLVKETHPKIAIIDLKMPGMTGQEVLAKISEVDPSIVSIVITGYGSIESAVETMKIGAFDFLTKPFEPEKLLESVKRGMKLTEEREEVEIVKKAASSIEAPLPVPSKRMSQKLANPAPLGLMGFGMTTVLLNIHNAGFFALGSMILAMGIFYGGIAQIIAGIHEFKTSNTFGATAFTSYGLFWLTLVALVLMPKLGWIDGPSSAFMGFYLALWGVFTFFMWLGTFGKNRALQTIFLTLAILFFLLAIKDWSGNVLIGKIAGWEGILCGSTAIYLAMAEVINESWGREVLPIGQISGK